MNPVGAVILAVAFAYFVVAPATNIARDYWRERHEEHPVDD